MEIYMFKIKTLIIGLIVITIAILGYKSKTASSNILVKSDYSHEELDIIDPVLVVDDYTLTELDIYKEARQRLINTLTNRLIIINTPSGRFYNPSLLRSEVRVSVVIQSGGGLVNLGRAITVTLNEMRRNGIKVDCHVSEAQSMAFTIMVLGCDRVIAKKTATLMEHRISMSGEGTTPTTFIEDNELSKLEARELGLDWRVWLSIARGEKDHVFTKDEIAKYKLVDEWVD